MLQHNYCREFIPHSCSRSDPGSLSCGQWLRYWLHINNHKFFLPFHHSKLDGILISFPWSSSQCLSFFLPCLPLSLLSFSLSSFILASYYFFLPFSFPPFLLLAFTSFLSLTFHSCSLLPQLSFLLSSMNLFAPDLPSFPIFLLSPLSSLFSSLSSSPPLSHRPSSIAIFNPSLPDFLASSLSSFLSSFYQSFLASSLFSYLSIYILWIFSGQSCSCLKNKNHTLLYVLV